MKRFALAVLMILLTGLAAQAADYEGLMIVKIDLKGNMNRDSTLIKAQLGSKVGGKFSYKTIAKDVKDLFFLGFFSDIKVDARKMAGGVVVTFHFVEYEKIEKIILKGNDELSKGDIKALLTIKKGSVYNKILIRNNINKIIEKYRQEGYINATVTPSVVVDKKSRKAVVTLTMKEGKKIVLQKIIIKGARQLEAKDVKGAIEDTHETALFRSGIFDAKKFEKDKQRIVAYYHDRGFIKMKIVSVVQKIRRVKPKKPKKGIYLTITVYEGPRYKAGDFTFTGNEVFGSKKIRDEFYRLKKGQHFNEGQNKKDFQGLWNRYQERGYIFCNIVPVKDIDEKKKVVNIKYRIVEMDKAHVEKIKIKGISRTKLYVVEREIRIKEGEVFNRAKILRSRQRLMNLRFFKDVKVDVEPGSAEGLMNLVFSMKEDRTGLFTLGAGYGSVSGFTFYQQLSENNFLGRGLRVFERLEFGQKKKSVQLGIDTPYLIKYDPTSLGFTVSYNITKIEDVSTNYIDMVNTATNDDYSFTRKSFEIQLRGGRSLGEYWRLYGSYTWAWIDSYDANFLVRETNYSDPVYVEYEDNIETLRTALSGGFRTKSSFRAGLIFDTRDYVGGPSRGIYWSQFFTYTGGILQGQSQYILSDTRFSFFIPLMWKFVFAVDLNFEVLFNQFGGDSEIYPGDELSFDGMTELRGWRGLDVDGRAKTSFLLEVRYPIERTMLWGVLFYDLGNVWDDHKQMNLAFKDYYHSFGFGFRLQLAMLPIRLYFAKRFRFDEKNNVDWEGSSKFFKGWETVFSVAGIF